MFWVSLNPSACLMRAQSSCTWKQTHGEAQSLAPVLQFVIACVESERLHDIGTSSQELSVQLPHCKHNTPHSALTKLELQYLSFKWRASRVLPASGCSAAASGVHGPAFT